MIVLLAMDDGGEVGRTGGIFVLRGGEERGLSLKQKNKYVR